MSVHRNKNAVRLVLRLLMIGDVKWRTLANFRICTRAETCSVVYFYSSEACITVPKGRLLILKMAAYRICILIFFFFYSINSNAISVILRTDKLLFNRIPG